MVAASGISIYFLNQARAWFIEITFLRTSVCSDHYTLLLITKISHVKNNFPPHYYLSLGMRKISLLSNVRCESMAFFNLTYLGPQDPIKVTCESSKTTLENIKKPEVPSSAASKTADKAADLSHARHDGSYVKYTELMHKHTRNPVGKLTNY